MSRATPQMKDLAARLIAWEAKAGQSSEPHLPATFLVCERLRPHLATLMGQGGFRAVLARALAVASAEVPSLATVQVDAEGALAGWDKSGAQVTPKELAESGLLVAQLLGLLVAFIGDNLTLRLVRDVWPTLSLEDLQFTKEILYEKADPRDQRRRAKESCEPTGQADHSQDAERCARAG